MVLPLAGRRRRVARRTARSIVEKPAAGPRKALAVLRDAPRSQGATTLTLTDTACVDSSRPTRHSCRRVGSKGAPNPALQPTGPAVGACPGERLRSRPGG